MESSVIETVNDLNCELLGAFLGTFGAALVAILTVYGTHYFSKKRYRERKEEIESDLINTYCGALHSVIVELRWHLQINGMIRNQVFGIKDKSIKAGRMIIDEPSTLIKTEFLKEARREMLNFKNFNPVITTHAQLYINKAEIINRSLQLNIIDETVERFEEEENFGKAVELYFDQLGKDFDTLEAVLKLNLKFALEEIKKYPDALIHEYYNHEEEIKEMESN